MVVEKIPPKDFCDGCRSRHRREVVNGLCLNCAQAVVAQRRKIFSRSEGNDFMARRFKLRNYFGGVG